MKKPSKQHVGMLAASVVVLTALTMQGLATFAITPGPIEKPPFSWPFLDYPMYSGPHYAGEAIERQVVVGVLEDSSEVIIEPADLGVTFWQFQHILNPSILRGDRELADAYRGIFEERFDGRLVGFRLENHPLIVTKQGLKEDSVDVLGYLSLESK